MEDVTKRLFAVANDNYEVESSGRLIILKNYLFLFIKKNYHLIIFICEKPFMHLKGNRLFIYFRATQVIICQPCNLLFVKVR